MTGIEILVAVVEVAAAASTVETGMGWLPNDIIPYQSKVAKVVGIIADFTSNIARALNSYERKPK